MECLGSSFSASFVTDIPLAGSEMLSGEGCFSEKDLLHFNCCWFVGWKCSSADCRWGTFPCCIAGQSWSAEDNEDFSVLGLSAATLILLGTKRWWLDWFWEWEELPVVPEQSEKRRDLRATSSCTWHETRTVSSALQMGFNLHSWRIHTEISPSYLLLLRRDTVNGLSGSKGCDLICLHLHVWLSINMGSGSFPPGCNLAWLLSPPWCAGALWWH